MEYYIKRARRDRRKKVTLALKKLATKEETLASMIGMSFEERCVLLHRLMPDVSIKPTTLARIYKEYKIKNKVIKKVKVVPEKSKHLLE